MSVKLKNLRALLGYNFRIVIGHTHWLIVVPIAATMLVLFMHMALKSLFTEKFSVASKTVELLAPILATYLCTHILGAEYRYRITELTFSKPYAAHRIVLLRILAVFLMVSFLMGVLLEVFRRGIYPGLPVWGIVKAAFPSTLFLSMLGLTVATLFRQPTVGLAFAGIYWGLDVYQGLRLHPLLSLQAYAGHLADNDLAWNWPLSKWLLLGLGALLYGINSRLMVRPEGPRNWRTTGRSVAILAGILLAYLVTGAACKVIYGIRHESQRPTLARLWYRQQFQVYGSLPVARLFGRPFALYLGRRGRSQQEGGEALLQSGRTPQDLQMLQRLIQRYPRSRWAPNALYELARAAKASVAQDRETSLDPLALYRRLAEQYPHSVFAPAGLVEMAQHAQAVGEGEAKQWAQEQLLNRYPDRPQAGAVAEDYARTAQANGPEAMQQALQTLEKAQRVAPPAGQPYLLGAAGDLLAALGRRQEAIQNYERAAQLLDQLYEEHRAEVQRREEIPQEEVAAGQKLLQLREDFRRRQAALR